MDKKTIRDIDVQGKRVLMRVDFNVPLQNGKVSDDLRIQAALPSICFLLEQGASIVLMSHLGRPKGKINPEMSLKPAAERLSELLDKPVVFATDCVGDDANSKAAALNPGDVLLLENLRFHPEETGKVSDPDEKPEMKKRQQDFATKLAALGEVYVNDAFGTAHRAHASVAVVAKHFDDCAAGFLLEKEIEYLGNALAKPEHPFVAIIGGAKISGKIDVITNLLGKVDTLIIGGGMAYTFQKAQGLAIGDSLLEEDKVALAGEILAQAKTAGVELLLPVDHVVADDFSASANTKVVLNNEIEPDWRALDIGPKTAELYAKSIASAKTVVWNGPMGCFEMAPFANGTQVVAQALADADCVSIIGGGDSASAVKQAGLADRMTHISTGGGASLEFLEGKLLPGIESLSDKLS